MEGLIMKRIIFLMMFLLAGMFVTGQELVGKIQEVDFNHTGFVEFRGYVYLSSDSIVLRYKRPGIFRQEKRFYLAVWGIRYDGDDVLFDIDNYGHSELLRHGRLSFSEDRKTFRLTLNNYSRIFTYRCSVVEGDDTFNRAIESYTAIEKRE